MIDLAPRPCDVGSRGPKGPKGPKKRTLYDVDLGLAKRRRTTAASAPGTRLVDLQILGEDGALMEEATIEEIWTPHATHLEIVLVDETWGTTTTVLDEETTLVDLDDPVLGPLGPLGGTSALHSSILREAQQQQRQVAANSPATSRATSPATSPKTAEVTDSDFGNLDWLINFKVDSVFEPKRPRGKQPASAASLASHKESAMTAATAQGMDAVGDVATPASPVASATSVVTCTAPTPAAGRSASPKAPKAPTPVPATAASTPPAAPAASPQPLPHPPAQRYSGPGKPPFTYTELIELALKDKGKLTVKEIYQWITKHFPFYQASDERWKNSVRHNLSINPHFRKESKAPQGAGHLWVVMDNNNKAKNSWKEERIQNFLASQISAAAAAEAAEAAEAANSVAVRPTATAMETERPERPSPRSAPPPPIPPTPSPQRPPTPPSPIATGARSHYQLNTWWSERISLERSAEEILSGVKREVGVEFLTPMDLDGDLDPVDMKDEKGFLYGDLTAEQVIAESGLQDELAGLYLLNDMASMASMTPDSLFPDDLNLGGLELPLSG